MGTTPWKQQNRERSFSLSPALICLSPLELPVPKHHLKCKHRGQMSNRNTFCVFANILRFQGTGTLPPSFSMMCGWRKKWRRERDIKGFRSASPVISDKIAKMSASFLRHIWVFTEPVPCFTFCKFFLSHLVVLIIQGFRVSPCSNHFIICPGVVLCSSRFPFFSSEKHTERTDPWQLFCSLWSLRQRVS